MADPSFSLSEGHTPTVLSVVGKWPANRPYLGVYDEEGFVGSLDCDQMVALRDALTAAVKHRPEDKPDAC